MDCSVLHKLNDMIQELEKGVKPEKLQELQKKVEDEKNEQVNRGLYLCSFSFLHAQENTWMNA